MAPYFSIILTHHNRIERCERAIDRLKSQSFQDFEIVLVDDASFVDIKPLEIALTGTNHKIIRHKKSMHVAHARVTGLMASRGTFILFHDDDDYILDNALFNIYKKTQCKPGEPHSFLLNIKSDEGINTQKHFTKSYYTSEVDILTYPFSLHSTVVPRDLIQPEDFNTDIRYRIDILVWVKIIQRTRMWNLHNIVVGVYDKTDDKSITRNACKSYKNKDQALHHFKSHLITSKKGQKKIFQMRVDNMYNYASCSEFRDYDASELFRLMLSSISHVSIKYFLRAGIICMSFIKRNLTKKTES